MVTDGMMYMSIWDHGHCFRTNHTHDIPTTLMVAMETTVDAPVPMLVLLHITVMPFIAAVMFTVKMEDRQYMPLEGSMLEAL